MHMLKHILKEIGSLSCIHLISTIDNLEFYQRLDLKLKTGMVIYQGKRLLDTYTE